MNRFVTASRLDISVHVNFLPVVTWPPKLRRLHLRRCPGLSPSDVAEVVRAGVQWPRIHHLTYGVDAETVPGASRVVEEYDVDDKIEYEEGLDELCVVCDELGIALVVT